MNEISDIESEKDKHGQLEAEFLDEIFLYVAVGEDGEELIDIKGTPHLSPKLQTFLAEAYYTDQLIDDWIQYFKDCDSSFCKTILELFLEPLQAKFFGKGLDRSSLDTSIALIFGNGTTIGQVCSFAKGLKDKTVTDVPGFCCLDAPYESQDWGEKVRSC